MSPSTRSIGVLNQGIGGNHLLTDGLGPNALARMDRDVLAQVGRSLADTLRGSQRSGRPYPQRRSPFRRTCRVGGRILSAYQQIIVRAHTHGIRVIGGTITPFAGSDYYHPGPASESDRQAINAWVRAPGPLR